MSSPVGLNSQARSVSSVPEAPASFVPVHSQQRHRTVHSFLPLTAPEGYVVTCLDGRAVGTILLFFFRFVSRLTYSKFFIDFSRRDPAAEDLQVPHHGIFRQSA